MPFEHPVTQGSEAWHTLRFGRPTASELDNLLTPEWKIRTGQMRQSYLCAKVAERLLGKSLDQGGSWAMEQGQLLETEAVPYYEFVTDTKVRRVGFVTTDDMRVGCSPDGLIGEDGGLEAKCPRPETHIGYLLGQTVPKDYLAQIHGSMYVTGRRWWLFFSYCRRLPPLILRAERDE